MIAEGRLNLEQLAETLLWENECVILPSLGGLIRRDHQASLNSTNHVVKPQSKSFFFNPTIHQTDGMLANYLAENFGVSYAEAVKMIDQEVLTIKDKIAAGEKVNWKSLGEFFGSAGKTFFIPKTEINFERETYGLAPIQLTPIAKIQEEVKTEITELVSPEPILKEITAVKPELDYSQTELQPELDQPAKLLAEKSNFRFIKWAVAATVIGALIFFGVRNENKTHITQKATTINFDLVSEGSVETTRPNYPETDESINNKEIDFETVPEAVVEETWTDDEGNTTHISAETEEPSDDANEIPNPIESKKNIETESTPEHQVTEEILPTEEINPISNYTFNLEDQYHIIVLKSVIRNSADQLLQDEKLYYLPVNNSFVHRIGIASSNELEALENILNEIRNNYPKAEIVNLKAYEKL